LQAWLDALVLFSSQRSLDPWPHVCVIEWFVSSIVFVSGESFPRYWIVMLHYTLFPVVSFFSSMFSLLTSQTNHLQKCALPYGASRLRRKRNARRRTLGGTESTANFTTTCSCWTKVREQWFGLTNSMIEKIN
jgi:hypothetical protein